MSEREIFHDSQADREGESDGEEVVFREDTLRVENSTPPTHNMVTANDLDVVIEGWERKFQHHSESIREIQLASEKANTNMNNIVRDGRAREGARGAAYRKCTKDSHNSSRDATPRINGVNAQQRRSAQHRSAQHRSAQPRSPRC